jgi:hypothetical protein
MRVEWNKVTWYSKLIALALFVALPFIGFYYGTQYGEIVGAADQAPMLSLATTTATQASATGLPAYYSDVAEWQTDSNNTSGGFTIAYPIDFSTEDNSSVAPSTDWRQNAGNAPGLEYFSLTVPKAFEAQTNFSDATLTVGASGSQSAIAQCMAADQSGGPATATSSVTINNIPFTIFQFSDAGAGNIYQTTSYRTLHAGKCYAVEYTVHSAQIGNYPSSYDLQPFDQSKIDSLMQNIIGTFKFS